MKDYEAIKWADEMLARGGQTDGGCTMSPDFNFKRCCLRHDVMINYRKSNGIPTKQADRILRKCIQDHGHPVIALIYWAYVRYANIIGDHIFATVLLVFFTIVALAMYFN